MRRMQTVAPPAAPAQPPGTPQAGRWLPSVHADNYVQRGTLYVAAEAA